MRSSRLGRSGTSRRWRRSRRCSGAAVASFSRRLRPAFVCSASTARRISATCRRCSSFADDNPGYQELVRAAATGLARSPSRATPKRSTFCSTDGIPSRDPIRAPLALAVAKVALRNTPLMLKVLQSQKDQAGRDRALAEGLRHARGRSRGRAVFCHGPSRLLGSRRRRRRRVGCRSR